MHQPADELVVEVTQGESATLKHPLIQTSSQVPEPKMTVSQFLLDNCQDGYHTIDELYIKAKIHYGYRGANMGEFIAMLTKYFERYPMGVVPKKLLYFTELPFGSSTFVMKPNGMPVGRIKVVERNY